MPGGEPAEVVDLANLGAGAPAPDKTSGSPSEIKPYDPAQDQETVRGVIAIGLLVALGIVILFLLVAGSWLAVLCYRGTSCMSATESLGILTNIANIVFTPLVGLVGSVTGFYFGSKAAAGK